MHWIPVIPKQRASRLLGKHHRWLRRCGINAFDQPTLIGLRMDLTPVLAACRDLGTQPGSSLGPLSCSSWFAVREQKDPRVETEIMTLSAPLQPPTPFPWAVVQVGRERWGISDPTCRNVRMECCQGKTWHDDTHSILLKGLSGKPFAGNWNLLSAEPRALVQDFSCLLRTMDSRYVSKGLGYKSLQVVLLHLTLTCHLVACPARIWVAVRNPAHYPEVMQLKVCLSCFCS